jgi:1-deoxy-D-xylulose-5-phosphate synthase
VAIQNLDVTFAIDRAGLVGQDGPTHHGAFDLSYLRCIPNMVIGAPSDENECRQMLYTAYQHLGPAAVRYPRGTGNGALISETMSLLPIGKGVTVREGQRVAILAFGTVLPAALEAGEALNATVVDMRWVKPLDEERVLDLAATHELLVTVEDNAIAGGAGSGVHELLAANRLDTPCLHLGIPDEFVEHGSQAEQYAAAGLDVAGIAATITERLGDAGPVRAEVRAGAVPVVG